MDTPVGAPGYLDLSDDGIDAGVTSFHIAGEVFADEAVKECAEDVLLEIPAVDRAADVVGYIPDLPLERSALFDAGHVG